MINKKLLELGPSLGFIYKKTYMIDKQPNERRIMRWDYTLQFYYYLIQSNIYIKNMVW